MKTDSVFNYQFKFTLQIYINDVEIKVNYKCFYKPINMEDSLPVLTTLLYALASKSLAGEI